MFHRWTTFVWERFNPIANLSLIIVFFLAHVAYLIDLELTPTLFSESFVFYIPVFIGTIIFFFKLRLFDEIKDYEDDLNYKGHRPLPRGLVKIEEAKKAVLVSILLEMGFFSFYGWRSLIACTAVIIYSLAMYKEFFIGKWLRRHLTTYAVTHTIVITFFSLLLFYTLSKDFNVQEVPQALYFSISLWFLFNIFEFSRKTYASGEEIPGLQSYSKVWGRIGAVLLVVFMSFGMLLLGSFNSIFLSAIVWALGIIYIVVDRKLWAKIYRYASLLYIFLTLLLVLV